jgi:hypothetical protein
MEIYVYLAEVLIWIYMDMKNSYIDIYMDTDMDIKVEYARI